MLYIESSQQDQLPSTLDPTFLARTRGIISGYLRFNLLYSTFIFIGWTSGWFIMWQILTIFLESQVALHIFSHG